MVSKIVFWVDADYINFKFYMTSARPRKTKEISQNQFDNILIQVDKAYLNNLDDQGEEIKKEFIQYAGPLKEPNKRNN